MASFEVGGNLQSGHDINVHCITSSHEGRTEIFIETNIKALHRQPDETRKISYVFSYINDIFAQWPQKEEYFRQFINETNQFHSIRNLQPSGRTNLLTFLHADVKITTENGRLIRNLHTKPTDTHQYLHKKVVAH